MTLNVLQRLSPATAIPLRCTPIMSLPEEPNVMDAVSGTAQSTTGPEARVFAETPRHEIELTSSGTWCERYRAVSGSTHRTLESRERQSPYRTRRSECTTCPLSNLPPIRGTGSPIRGADSSHLTTGPRRCTELIFSACDELQI